MALFSNKTVAKEQDIEAISDSAYVVRRGRRELQNPKLLSLAIQMRGKYMVDIAKFAVHIGEMEKNKAILEDILDATMALLAEHRNFADASVCASRRSSTSTKRRRGNLNATGPSQLSAGDSDEKLILSPSRGQLFTSTHGTTIKR